jgi:hypothetical protein
MRSFLSASGSEASQSACKHLTRILRQILGHIAFLSSRRYSKHTEMPSYRVERCFFVVTLYAVVPAPCAGGRYLGNRSGISVTERFRRLQHEAIRSPIGDTTQVGKSDTGIFLKNPLGRYP